MFVSTSTLAQNIGINSNGAIPNSSAMLDVSATDKGMLIPRVSLISTSDITTNTYVASEVYDSGGLNQKSGTYLLTIVDENATRTLKLVIQ